MLFILAGAMLATQAPAADPKPPVAPGKQTLQQQFDAATAAADADKCEEAVAAFSAIEAKPAAQKSEAVRSIIAVRKGICLAKLDRTDEAEGAIRSGLPSLMAKGDAFERDIWLARMTLGRTAMTRLDYETAIDEFKAVLAKSTGGARFQPLLYLTRAMAFDGGPEVLTYADEAVSLIKADPEADKDAIASAQTLHARVLMNQGKYQEAYSELKNSLKLQGGLTLKVTLPDIVTRSDLALAALLVDKRDEARNYLAYTGAGRMKDAPFASATNMDTPSCGETSGLKRDDFAVVEFKLNDDGSVDSATPIYTTGGREVALEFARAVSQWSWSAENAKAIPLFHRYAARVEMRCSTAGDAPSIKAPLASAFEEWSGPISRVIGSTESEAKALPLVQAALSKAEASQDDKTTVGMLTWLGKSELLAMKDRIAYVERAKAIARRTAPVQVYSFIDILRAHLHEKSTWRPIDKAALRRLLAEPAVSNDPLSAATVRLLIATPDYRSPEQADADALLDAVVSEDRLPPLHPLKINALLQKASRSAARGDIAAAQQSFEKTGLTEQQCALIGIAPAMKSNGVGSNDFPMEALRMGFEGWVKTEFDIAANGRTISPRAIISYPPFIFNEAATGVIRDARFQSSYRPSSGTACNGRQQSISFKMYGR